MLFFFSFIVSLSVSFYGASAIHALPVALEAPAMNARPASLEAPGVRLRKASRLSVAQDASFDASTSRSGIRVGDVQDSVYVAELTVGSQVVQVVLDTGSSDLWIDPGRAIEDVGGTVLGNDADQLRLGYASGGVVGKAALVPVSLGSYAVSQQILLSANWTYELDALSTNDIRGILGLSFDSAAQLPRLLGTENLHTTFLSNVFAQNPSAGNFTTFFLGRGDVEGLMTINELPAQFADAVKDVPTINAWRSPDTNVLRRWTIAVASLDVGGKTVPLTSQITGAPNNAALAVLDTGSTLTYLPNGTISAVYSGIPGALYAAKSNVWLMPCDSQVAINFTISGRSYAINPLDLIIPYSVSVGGSDTIFCAAAFRSTSADLRKLLTADMWLGDSFLRNVFQVLHYGDSTTEKQRPLVQLLGLTDATAAAAEYAVEREALRKNHPREADLTDPVVLAAIIDSFPAPADTNLTSTESDPTNSTAQGSSMTTPTQSFSPHNFPSQHLPGESGALSLSDGTLSCGFYLATLSIAFSFLAV